MAMQFNLSQLEFIRITRYTESWPPYICIYKQTENFISGNNTVGLAQARPNNSQVLIYTEHGAISHRSIASMWPRWLSLSSLVKGGCITSASSPKMTIFKMASVPYQWGALPPGVSNYFLESCHIKKKGFLQQFRPFQYSSPVFQSRSPVHQFQTAGIKGSSWGERICNFLLGSTTIAKRISMRQL